MNKLDRQQSQMSVTIIIL